MTNTTLRNLAALGLGLLANTGLGQAPVCDSACLTDIAQQYVRDVVTQDYAQLPWAAKVRYTENNVGMQIGDGFWGAGPGVPGPGLVVADPGSGNVVWYGITTEHGQAAYHGIRLKVTGRAISEVESYVGREGTPDLFAPVDGFELPEIFAQIIPAAARTPRERMVALVDGYYNSRQLNDGQVFTSFHDQCERVTNGVSVTHGEHWAARLATGCRAQLEQGLFKPVDRIRARRYPVVDEEAGVVVALVIEDHAARYVDYQALDGTALKVDVEYPNSRGMLELFKISDGAIQRIEGVSVFLPYYIHTLWNE